MHTNKKSEKSFSGKRESAALVLKKNIMIDRFNSLSFLNEVFK